MLTTFLISEIDAFSLVLSSGNNERIFHEKVQEFFINKRGRYLSGETGPEFE